MADFPPMQPTEVLRHKHFSKNQKLTLWSTTAGFGLENMDVMFISFALSSIIASLRISNFAGGLIATIFSLGTLVGGLCFGMLADKFGRARIFTSTLVIVALATAGMYFAHNIWVLYALRFIVGAGTGAEYSAGVTMVAEAFAGKKIGRLMSIVQIGGQGGSVLAALSAAFIIPRWGWNALFLVGLLPIIFAFLIRIHLKDSEEFEHAKEHRQENQQENSRVPLLAVFQTPAMALQTIGLILMMMIQTGGYYGLMNWLPKIMQKQLGLSISSSSMWMIATIAGMSLGMYAFGFILDNFGPRLAFGIFLVVAAASVYLIPMANSAWSLLLIMMMVGFFSNGMYGGYGVVVSRLYGTDIRVTANSVVSCVGKLFGGFFPALIGLMMDKTSLSVVMMFFSAIYIFSFLVMLSIPALGKKTQF
ncbi:MULTISPECIES: MFS transporter [Fructobacillus]|jgi:MFS family permease|uniref:MFS family (AraJ) n=1 Tax=Fructobacillus cardui TaxID=2893170 RepID=A0ABM9MZQ3_9LACO|nr:MFS transporter [Fructobacillus sp. EFB-N1]KMK53742.1 putative niacin/nicotinamide transporter NaiP [Fructobacillus sp. EFB-N1]CAK1222414.1 MFS family (AraJ) [Fructobacillus cardui]CAK1251378.1 MFS family (AraJ) [Fructobacillus cardui]